MPFSLFADVPAGLLDLAVSVPARVGVAAVERLHGEVQRVAAALVASAAEVVGQDALAPAARTLPWFMDPRRTRLPVAGVRPGHNAASALPWPVARIAIGEPGSKRCWSRVRVARGSGDTFSSIENLVGTEFNDWLAADSGDNRLEGRRGNDWLFGGTDEDTLFGGEGHDYLFGGRGDDVLYGGVGADVLSGDAGDDVL